MEIKLRVWDGIKFHFFNALSGLYGIIPISVDMSTGLSDKTGKEIYNGDILIDSLGTKYKVIWDEQNARFLGVTARNTLVYVGREPASVIIGNVHENENVLFS